MRSIWLELKRKVQHYFLRVKLKQALSVDKTHYDAVNSIASWLMKHNLTAANVTVDNHVPLIINRVTWEKTIYVQTALSREAMEHFCIFVINSAKESITLLGIDNIESYLKNVKALPPGKYYFIHCRDYFSKEMAYV